MRMKKLHDENVALHRKINQLKGHLILLSTSTLNEQIRTSCKLSSNCYSKHLKLKFMGVLGL